MALIYQGESGDDYLSHNEEQTLTAAAIINAQSKGNHDNKGNDCLECGVEIPVERRELIPGCRNCVKCQGEMENTRGRKPIYGGAVKYFDENDTEEISPDEENKPISIIKGDSRLTEALKSISSGV